ncbi:MAG TPA: DUF4350 domain-containing protein [Steroidobacteraceae bacterium]
MKERLVTLGLAIAALFFCYALFLPKPPPENLAAPRPLSTNSGDAGYQAAWQWLKAEHIPVIALRDRFEQLSANKAPRPTGNVLLTTLPHKLPVRPEETTRLDAWIERGNTVVIAAALDDTPAWALEGDARLVRDVGRLARLKLESNETEQADKASTSQRLKSTFKALTQSRTVNIEPRGTHPLMKDIHALRVGSDLPASRWHATPMDTSGVLQIAQVVDGGNAALWVRRQGKGQVILLGVAGLFSNRDIGSADNAKLLANVIGWSLEPGGAVIFDDAHQGAVDYYDAKAFYADPRLHRTLGWLVLLWFVFVLGIQRFRGQPSARPVADVTAFVSSSGDFFASTLTPATAGGRLLANFFNSIHRRRGTREDGSPPWEWLSSQAAVSRSDVIELQELQARIQLGRRFNLSRLQSLLSQLQGKII